MRLMRSGSFWLLFLALSAFLTVACSSDSSPPESVRTADFDSCTGFLELEDVREAAGRTDITLAEPNVNSGTQEASNSEIQALCVIEYVTPAQAIGGPTMLEVEGPSMTLTALAFHTSDGSRTHQDNIAQGLQQLRDEANPRSEIVADQLGPDSYQLTVNADGVGSILGFLLRPYVVQLRTTLPQQPEGSEPLFTLEELLVLTNKVRASLGGAR